MVTAAKCVCSNWQFQQKPGERYGETLYGIDLHRNQFTCCVQLENGRNYLSQWQLKDLPRFIRKLRAEDELALEITGNTRLFYDAVVARLAVVDTIQFRVISRSVKKTDANDARLLALYLSKGLLPEVRMKR
jgi:hypothetical protein